MTASTVEICHCVFFICALLQCLLPGLLERTSPVLCYFIIWGFVFFLLICCSVFLSEMNASFSLHQSRRLLWWNLELSWPAWWSWIWQECCVTLKSYPFPLSSFLFSAAETMTLACLCCFAREACKFQSILVGENFCKKENRFYYFGNFVERKECFAVISSFKGKSGFLTHRAARSISTFSWPWSCASFLLCTPKLQFQSLWSLIGFWNH